MARVPYVTREELDQEGQTIYDQIRRDRNSPEVGLQFRAMLNSPVVAGHLTSMGAQLRFQSSLPDNLKELAIILVARVVSILTGMLCDCNHLKQELLRMFGTALKLIGDLICMTNQGIMLPVSRLKQLPCPFLSLLITMKKTSMKKEEMP